MDKGGGIVEGVNTIGHATARLASLACTAPADGALVRAGAGGRPAHVAISTGCVRKGAIWARGHAVAVQYPVPSIAVSARAVGAIDRAHGAVGGACEA